MTFEADARRGTGEAPAARLLRRSWWVLGVRGLVAIVLGIMALTRPAMTVRVFLLLVGIYLAVDGIVTIFSAFHASGRGQTFWPYLIEGLISFIVGILGMTRPGPFATLLLVLVAVRTFIVGVIEIGTGISVRGVGGKSGFLLGIAGLLSLAFGLLFLLRPSAGVLVLAWTFGIYAIAFGVFLDAEAFQVRSALRRLENQAV